MTVVGAEPYGISNTYGWSEEHCKIRVLETQHKLDGRLTADEMCLCILKTASEDTECTPPCECAAEHSMNSPYSEDECEEQYDNTITMSTDDPSTPYSRTRHSRSTD
jgi:hypothetical protein